MLSRIMLRLLPVQVLLAAIGAVNGIVSSLFASNYIGEAAMSAVALYFPINMLLGALGFMLFGGATILCGKYMGQGQREKLQNIFSLDLIIAALISFVFIAAMLVMAIFGITGFFTRDPQVRPLFHAYLLGQAIGLFPFLLGNQLSAFLSLQNNTRRTTAAGLAFIAANLVLNFLFVQLLHMGTFGLALASSLGMWVFFLVQAQFFCSDRALVRLSLHPLDWSEAADLISIGVPGALTNGYETIRGLIVNKLITVFVGSVGLSAFAACNNFLMLFWAIPYGMMAVSRMLISVADGEEDRQTLTDVMRVMFRRFLPIQCMISVLIIAFAVPITHMFYHDPADPVFMMTVWGFRIMPICMPLSVIGMHFVCYSQISRKRFLVHLLTILDGVACVAGFTAILIPFLGIESVYAANVLNGIVVVLTVIVYATVKNGHIPRTMDQLMTIPDSFGVSPAQRLDVSVRSVAEVVLVSEQIMNFCERRGIDSHRSSLAGLAMEEMAGNVVEHGFHKDRRHHSIDIRVAHKGDDLILRIKDDCRPFDPIQQQKMMDPEDFTSNIGLRMIFKRATDIKYQSILGMNVLTIRI
ncbi:MAG: ATP-binding protein [Firmicutes bacterium]|nr:ATP-binding protein [Bacillota bacterium]